MHDRWNERSMMLGTYHSMFLCHGRGEMTKSENSELSQFARKIEHQSRDWPFASTLAGEWVVIICASCNKRGH